MRPLAGVFEYKGMGGVQELTDVGHCSMHIFWVFLHSISFPLFCDSILTLARTLTDNSKCWEEGHHGRCTGTKWGENPTSVVIPRIILHSLNFCH